jgi:hypothetical protein
MSAAAERSLTQHWVQHWRGGGIERQWHSRGRLTPVPGGRSRSEQRPSPFARERSAGKEVTRERRPEHMLARLARGVLREERAVRMRAGNEARQLALETGSDRQRHPGLAFVLKPSVLSLPVFAEHQAGLDGLAVPEGGDEAYCRRVRDEC